jgi:hypothetical protein
MEITYRRDDRRGRIVASAFGDMSLAALGTMIERQIADAAWTYALLFDARAVTAALPDDDILALVDHVRALSAANGPRGPVAIVTRDRTLGRKLLRYARLVARFGVRFQVFDGVTPAERWLDEQPLGRVAAGE